MKFTPEQIARARSAVLSHERHCEQHYEDTKFELQLALGLDDDEVDELMEMT